MPALLAQYQEKTEFVRNFKPPSMSAKTLGTWSSRFSWPDRAAELDANWDEISTEERRREMTFGLALDYERVRKLKRLARFLEAQIYELSVPNDEDLQVYHNVWLPDVKQVGSGDDAERVDIERFNSALFTQYRETLNDLAKEEGGRVQKTKSEHTGPDGDAIRFLVEHINARGHDGGSD